MAEIIKYNHDEIMVWLDENMESIIKSTIDWTDSWNDSGNKFI
jgi:hypothetical protein